MPFNPKAKKIAAKMKKLAKELGVSEGSLVDKQYFPFLTKDSYQHYLKTQGQGLMPEKNLE